MRILVFSLRHSKFTWMSTFPHVRGHVLATYLRRMGEDAEFRALPVEGRYDVAICSDYQGDARWMGLLEERMAGISARRMFCMADYATTAEHWSTPMIEWFAARGGILCHLRECPFAACQHYIGVGVDETVRADTTGERHAVLFDVPRPRRRDASASFAVEQLAAIRQAHPRYRLLGSGPADCPIRDAFDEWIAYGLPHDEYVRTFARCLAVIPGSSESLGLAMAEAQVAGAAIVAPPGWIKAEMLVPSAAIVDTDPVQGLARVAAGDAAQIAREAADRFSPTAMAGRVMAAIHAVG
ncbi:MAG TPA: hypothetical protein VL049_00560 [Candidatus Dormibacteraeota bacterium]|nr:hypothetical protein [Candidatus Dormibacteraeota bacterium]